LTLPGVTAASRLQGTSRTAMNFTRAPGFAYSLARNVLLRGRSGDLLTLSTQDWNGRRPIRQQRFGGGNQIRSLSLNGVTPISFLHHPFPPSGVEQPTEH